MTEVVPFNYAVLDQETQIAVRARTSEIKTQMRKTAQGVVQIGESLADVQTRLANHHRGAFQAWVETEFGWGLSTAYNFIHVYERFGSYANFAQLNVATSALYLLARPSTSPEAVDEALQRAEAGQAITHQTAQAIVQDHKTLATPVIPLGATVLYLGERYRVTGTTNFSVWMRHLDSGRREIAKNTDVEIIELEAPPAPPTQPSYHPADPEQNHILETHPHFGALLTNTAVCPACGEIHAQWSPMAGGFWLCAKCGKETPDDAMRPYTRQDADAEARMERRRQPSSQQASTAPANAQHSSDSNEWYTPAKYVEAARAVMGSIDLDPASCALANRVIQSATFHTIAHDGLAQVWSGNVWLNSPYGREGNESNQSRWSVRLIDAWRQHEIQSAVMLCNASTGAGWFQALWHYPLCFTDHRIEFYNEYGPQENPTHYNCFVYFGDAPERFYRHFEQFGKVIVPRGVFSEVLP